MRSLRTLARVGQRGALTGRRLEALREDARAVPVRLKVDANVVLGRAVVQVLDAGRRACDRHAGHSGGWRVGRCEEGGDEMPDDDVCVGGGGVAERTCFNSSPA